MINCFKNCVYTFLLYGRCRDKFHGLIVFDFKKWQYKNYLVKSKHTIITTILLTDEDGTVIKIYILK